MAASSSERNRVLDCYGSSLRDPWCQAAQANLSCQPNELAKELQDAKNKITVLELELLKLEKEAKDFDAEVRNRVQLEHSFTVDENKKLQLHLSKLAELLGVEDLHRPECQVFRESKEKLLQKLRSEDALRGVQQLELLAAMQPLNEFRSNLVADVANQTELSPWSQANLRTEDQEKTEALNKELLKTNSTLKDELADPESSLEKQLEE